MPHHPGKQRIATVPLGVGRTEISLEICNYVAFVFRGKHLNVIMVGLSILREITTGTKMSYWRFSGVLTTLQFQAGAENEAQPDLRLTL